MADTRVSPTLSGPAVDREGEAPQRWLAAAAWVGFSLALGALYLRISRSSSVDSDGANTSLQAWDLLHGHLLLHGWDIGDANFYFLEQPVNALTEAVFGLGNLAAHAGSALTYLIVTVMAAAVAVTGSRGSARAVRCAVVVIVLAAPVLTLASMRLGLEEPDHMGTSAFILGSFLLIDRVPERRFTAPLLCVLLCAGEFSDLTVAYVAVPAIVLVCGARALAARRHRSPDTAFVAAAVASVPLEILVRTVITHLGGFVVVAPKARIASPRLWPHQAVITWHSLRILFGAVDSKFTVHSRLSEALGLACLLAVALGLARVAWRWRRASRAEQLVSVAIVANIGIFSVSVLAILSNAHELAAVLPCGAVLAARALVPARISREPVAVAAMAVTTLFAALPLASAATQPLDVPATTQLTAWLEAHHLEYGLAGYWDASATTVQSGGKVMVRSINVRKGGLTVPNYEDSTFWYDPARHDARFVVAQAHGLYPVAPYERFFGKPAATYVILIYRENLLRALTHLQLLKPYIPNESWCLQRSPRFPPTTPPPTWKPAPPATSPPTRTLGVTRVSALRERSTDARATSSQYHCIDEILHYRPFEVNRGLLPGSCS
jgi:hypothetical protein